jgi:hypothetical protein
MPDSVLEEALRRLEEKNNQSKWYESAFSWLPQGFEDTLETVGSVLTSPFRPTPEGEEWYHRLNPINYLPGFAEHAAYEDWKESGKDPSIPLGIPSWRQMEEWGVPGASFLASEGEKPEGYEMARMGMAETAEAVPFLFGGSAKSAKEILDITAEQALKQSTKTSGEKAVNKVMERLAKKGKLPQYNIKEIEELVPKFTEKAEVKRTIETPAETTFTAEQSAAVDAIMPKVVKTKALTVQPLQIPQYTLTATNEQKVLIHQVAQKRGLSNTQYRKVLKNATGKSSAKYMTRDEADRAVQALEGLVIRSNGKYVIPKTTAIIPKALIDDIAGFKEILSIDLLRQKTSVLRDKFGSWGREVTDQLLESEIKYNTELAAYKRQSQSMAELIGNNAASKTRVWKALDNPLDELASPLNESERKVYDYFKAYFNKWADDLKLPASKRRNNYVTHIFEAQIEKDAKAGKKLSMEMMAALDYNASKTINNPFFNRRYGKTIGLKLDPFAAADVYEYYALKKVCYEPMVHKISAMAKMLRDTYPSNFKYLDDMVKKIAGRPSWSDVQLNKSFNKVVDTLAKTPGLNKLIPEQLREVSTRGNFAALVAHNMNSILYLSWLGFRPSSAIRNFSQQILAVSQVGPANFAKGLSYLKSSETRSILEKSITLKTRTAGQFIPGLEVDQLQRLPKRLQDWGMAMFKLADKDNVINSFLGGYAQGKSLGLPEEWAVRLGDEVAQSTQFLYTKMARSLFEESVMGRFLTPFTSWPRNFTELMTSWVRGNHSRVLEEYYKQTGTKLWSDNWAKRHQQALTYMAFLSGAYAVDSTTDLKAVQYTGWTSVQQLANLLSGDLPALTVPAGLAKIVGGGMTGDEQMTKSGWNDIRPDKFVQIANQFTKIAEGEQDWLSLFFYIERAKKDDPDGDMFRDEGEGSILERDNGNIFKRR